MINVIEETSFGNAWWKAIQFVLNNKKQLVFGMDKKHAWDSTQLIELTGNAITQILNEQLHPLSTFKAIDSYKREFTYEYLEEYKKKRESEKFDYLYMDRLANNMSISQPTTLEEDDWGTTDQITYMRRSIKEQKQTQLSRNYTLATTWYPDIDGLESPSSPCLQIIQLRWNPGNLIDMHLVWRSRDLYNAWQANIIAITNMINREVILPNDCKLNRITDYSTSLHIYDTDIEQAKRVNMVWPR
jgi:thymidylate synthase